MKQTICILLVFFTINIQAQKKAKMQIPLYVKAGFNMNNVKTSNNGSSNKQGGALNANLGIETVIPVIKYKAINRLSFNPSIQYNPTSYKPSTNFNPINNTQIQNVRVNYLTIELPICYNIRSRAFQNSYNERGVSPLFIGIGPYFSYALSGKYKTLGIASNQSVYGQQKMAFGNSVNDNRTKFDAGYVIKAGMDFMRFRLALQKNIGIANVYPKDIIVNGNSIVTRGFYATFSYTFSKFKNFD